MEGISRVIIIFRNIKKVHLFKYFLLLNRRAEEDSYTYIDAFNRGAGHLPRSCPALIGQPRHNIHREAYAAVDPMHVFQRMVNNLIQCSRVHWDHGRGDQNGLRNQMHFSRLACCVTPGQTPSVVAYAELCVFLGAQLEEAIQLLQVRLPFNANIFQLSLKTRFVSLGGRFSG